MVKAPPAHLGFLAEVLRRYPVRVFFRGEVLPEGPLRGEKLFEEGDLALYWEGPPPSREVQEALRLLLQVFREVLELKERELALLRSQEESARLLGLLLHEIKNPLMSVLGALELALETEGLPQEGKELLAIAEKSARRIQELLQKAQEYLRLGQGVRLKSERVDLKALLRQVADEIRPLARRKGIQLRLVLPKREAWVYGDREWLYQAVLNVLNNSVKYTPEGGRVAVRLLVGQDQYGMAISDTGPGIPQEEQARVFEPFYRASTRGEVENRWHRGLWEVLWNHRIMLFNPRYGRLGLVAMPYFLLFEALGPVVEVLGYVSLPLFAALGLLNPPFALLFLLFALGYGVLLSHLAVGVETLLLKRYPSLGERLRLLLLPFLEVLGYRQVLALERFLATFQVWRKRGVWGEMRRKGLEPSQEKDHA